MTIMQVPLTQEDVLAFHQRYIPEPNTGCWLWIGAFADGGYGRMSLANLRLMKRYGGCGAHRISYQIHKGPIPDGLCIDHLCRVPGCVNPDHLEAVTHAENVRRGVIGTPGMHPMIERAKKITHCPKGHAYSAENLRVDRKGRRLCKQCHRDRATMARRARGVPERKKGPNYGLKVNRIYAARKDR